MVTRRGVFHVKGGNRTQNQDQPAKHLQRQLQRPIKGLQEVNFQRSQPQGAEAETSHHQTVNQALFGGVEPLHGRRTGASVHKANTITDGQREQHSEPQWTVRHETTQDGTATHHQDAPENHLLRTDLVLHGASYQHDGCGNEATHSIGQAQLANIPFLVETVGSVNGLGHTIKVVDRAVLKNILEVRPSIQNTDTEVGQHSEQQDAPALALFLCIRPRLGRSVSSSRKIKHRIFPLLAQLRLSALPRILIPNKRPNRYCKKLHVSSVVQAIHMSLPGTLARLGYVHLGPQGLTCTSSNTAIYNSILQTLTCEAMVTLLSGFDLPIPRCPGWP